MNVVLLDRDGTLILDPPDERVDRIDKIKLFPDSIKALKYLADSNFSAVIVTNQAGIAEGRMTAQDFEVINEKVLELLSPSGITVLHTYMSSRSPKEPAGWSKPGPGMLQKAAEDYDLNLSETFMVGDRTSDVQAGIAAGTKTILVKTANVPVDAPEATYTAPTLLDAAKYIVSQSHR